MDKELISIIGGALALVVALLFFVFKEFIKELIKKASADISPEKANNYLKTIIAVLFIAGIVLLGHRGYNYFFNTKAPPANSNLPTETQPAPETTPPPSAACNEIKQKAVVVLKECNQKILNEENDIEKTVLIQYRDIITEINQEDCQNIHPSSSNTLDSISIYIKSL